MPASQPSSASRWCGPRSAARSAAGRESQGRVSVRPTPCDDRSDGHRKYSEIATDAEVLDVIPLDRDPLLQRELTSSEDLHRARDAGLDAEPDVVLGSVHRDEVSLLGPRPDEAHVSTDDVEELRQLVEAETADDPPNMSYAWVIAELEDGLFEPVERN